jgi:outer membrane protein TolC
MARSESYAIRPAALTVDFLQVVVAQESLLGAQQHLLQSETQYLQAGVQLMLALGGGWSEQDLPKMNGIGLYHETIAQ